MRLFTCLFVCSLVAHNLSGQAYYFPPLQGAAWATNSPAELGWNTALIPGLYDFLDEKGTKAFIVLHNGEIVLEQYFDTFTQDSFWYWASAGKTLTAFMVGLAQQEGLLDINDPSSDYLGAGWTSLTPAQEQAITVWHQLTMTSGLDDSGDPFCTLPSCLQYLADPGQRWAYHNGPYTLLDGVISGASGLNMNQFFNTRIRSRTGIVGLWLPSGYNNVFYSTARNMAKFGSLVLNHGAWNGDTLLTDQAYWQAMTTPSQTLNPSYGYLWWLNGQPSYRLPGLQVSFPGPLIPPAPADLIAALGKNDQKLYVLPSRNLVVVRLGEASGDAPLALSSFDTQLWSRLMPIIDGISSASDPTTKPAGLWLFPNPAADQLELRTDLPVQRLAIYNALGQLCLSQAATPSLEVSTLPAGAYWLVASDANGRILARQQWLKQ